MNPKDLDISKIGVSQKPVKVKAFDECEPTSDNKMFSISGTVTRGEAVLLEDVLRLFRREAGSLQPEELQLVASLLTLQGKRA
jgi:hypothetical protein